MTFDSVIQIARDFAPKVGKRWFTEGRIVDIVQKLFPDHCIQAVELCKGADRYRRPQSPVTKQSAPWRMTFGIHRQTGETFHEPHWEQWSLLSCRQQIRTCTPARLLVTVFAQVRNNPERPVDTQEESHYPKRSHRSSEDDQVPKRHKGIDNSVTTEDPSDVTEPLDKNHGPKFLQLSSEQRQQLIRMHNNLGHPDSNLLGNVLRDQGWPPE